MESCEIVTTNKLASNQFGKILLCGIIRLAKIISVTLSALWINYQNAHNLVQSMVKAPKNLQEKIEGKNIFMFDFNESISSMGYKKYLLKTIIWSVKIAQKKLPQAQIFRFLRKSK